MTDKEKDTSPFVKPTYRKCIVRIEERNIPPSSVFDTTVEYPSDDLPEWFKGLKLIVEDQTFSSMVINIGTKVQYHITIVG